MSGSASVATRFIADRLTIERSSGPNDLNQKGTDMADPNTYAMTDRSKGAASRHDRVATIVQLCAAVKGMKGLGQYGEQIKVILKSTPDDLQAVVDDKAALRDVVGALLKSLSGPYNGFTEQSSRRVEDAQVVHQLVYELQELANSLRG